MRRFLSLVNARVGTAACKDSRPRLSGRKPTPAGDADENQSRLPIRHLAPTSRCGDGLQCPDRFRPIYMFSTCNYTIHMATAQTKMIQLRNVPDALHRSLKARAALAGMSLSDYLIGEIKEIAERPTLAELRDRLHTRKPVTVSIDTARMVREERDSL